MHLHLYAQSRDDLICYYCAWERLFDELGSDHKGCCPCRAICRVQIWGVSSATLWATAKSVRGREFSKFAIGGIEKLVVGAGLGRPKPRPFDDPMYARLPWESPHSCGQTCNIKCRSANLLYFFFLPVSTQDQVAMDAKCGYGIAVGPDDQSARSGEKAPASAGHARSMMTCLHFAIDFRSDSLYLAADPIL